MILDFYPPMGVVRELFLEYSGQLGIDLCFQNFQQEVENLPDKYTSLIVAFEDDVAAGCVALRPLNWGTGEMKRLYVRERFRGTGLGRRLAAAILNIAREQGFASVQLDTLRFMTEAISLYKSLGFKEMRQRSESANQLALYFILDLAELK